MMRAMVMVLPMVNTPHGLPAKAFTTTIPRPANVTGRINSTAIMATCPAKRLISVRAISDSERPLCRNEAVRTMKSWTQPANTAPISSHRNPGAKPN